MSQTLNHLFMKEILSYLHFVVSGVCSRGRLQFSSKIGIVYQSYESPDAPPNLKLGFQPWNGIFSIDFCLC